MIYLSCAGETDVLPTRSLAHFFMYKTEDKTMPKPTMDDILVDEIDRDLLEGHKWHTHKNNRTHYAERKVPKAGGGQATQLLHRVILSRVLGRELVSKEQVDHRNGNGLDNRRANLRLANRSQNQQNTKPRVGCSSVYKGVYWNKRAQKWRAYINLNGKQKSLGYFTCEIEAARVYNKACIELFGRFARPNLIDGYTT